MHTRTLTFLALSIHVAIARLFHSLPEDTYAYPKFRVVFLNSLPVLNATVERWLKDGLTGGELEFLDQQQRSSSYSAFSDPKGIESGQSQDETINQNDSSMSDGFTLELLKLGPRDSYVCLMPRPLDNIPSPPPDDQPDDELTPARGWALLQPLTGTCLYVQFFKPVTSTDTGGLPIRIATITKFVNSKNWYPKAHGWQRLGHYSSGAPEEDPEWESYTLGRAPTQPAPGADLTVAQQNAQATNLELAKNAGSRYLVQRWGDGTLCDKTGKNREVEVQFHCSMTMTDSILLVKETKTCSYIFVINTPRLCGEPGFKSRRDAAEEAEIRCREVVHTLPEKPLHYPVTDYPVKGGPVPRKANLPAAAVPGTPGKSSGAKSAVGDSSPDKGEDEEDENQDQIVEDLLQTIETLVKKTKTHNFKAGKGDELAEIIIQLGDDMEDEQAIREKILDAIHEAGYEISNAEVLELNFEGDLPLTNKEKGSKNGKNSNKEGKKRKFRRSTDDVDEYARDEL